MFKKFFLFILLSVFLASCSNNSIDIETYSKMVDLSEKELDSIGGEEDQNITPENFKRLILHSEISNYGNLKNARIEFDGDLKKNLGPDVIWTTEKRKGVDEDNNYVYTYDCVINMKNISKKEIEKALKDVYITVVWDGGQHTDRFDNNFK